MRRAERVRPYPGSQSIGRGVGASNNFVLRIKRKHGKYRAKNLVSGDGVAIFDPAKNGWFDKVAVLQAAAETMPTRHKRCRAGSALHVFQHAPKLLLRDQWTDFGCRLHAWPDMEFARPLTQIANDFLVDTSLHVQARTCHTVLTTVGKNSP